MKLPATCSTWEFRRIKYPLPPACPRMKSQTSPHSSLSKKNPRSKPLPPPLRGTSLKEGGFWGFFLDVSCRSLRIILPSSHLISIDYRKIISVFDGESLRLRSQPPCYTGDRYYISAMLFPRLSSAFRGISSAGTASITEMRQDAKESARSGGHSQTKES